MKRHFFTNSQIINGIALGFSLSFLAAAFITSFYTGEWGHVFYKWYRLLISPSPLVTDYFKLGSLPSAMLNAGVCGLFCVAFMIGLKGDSRANTLAGYFLVVAHCFYGLNLLNMIPCFLAPFIYFKLKKLSFKRNLHICMFTTAFSPFISEVLFRYTSPETFLFGRLNLTVSGVLLAIIFSVMFGFVVPAILPGAMAWHKGYNLYNGGLAFGLFGFFLFNLMYKTMGIEAPEPLTHTSIVYDNFGYSYTAAVNIFFILVFLVCMLTGYVLNGKNLKGFRYLVKDTGYSSDFAEKYGMPLCLINIGFYGLCFLLYINLLVYFTDGAGFTGPTVGVILAALTFTAMGQHPQNVWPIIVGYQLLYVVVWVFCHLNGRPLTWTLSTQAYINGVAFATGLCPIVGRYGIRAGILAGFMCASMCTSTSYLHGGFVLYNGGFTTGITALILIPILEHYVAVPREELKQQSIHMQDMITLVGNFNPYRKHKS